MTPPRPPPQLQQCMYCIINRTFALRHTHNEWTSCYSLFMPIVKYIEFTFDWLFGVLCHVKTVFIATAPTKIKNKIQLIVWQAFKLNNSWRMLKMDFQRELVAAFAHAQMVWTQSMNKHKSLDVCIRFVIKFIYDCWLQINMTIFVVRRGRAVFVMVSAHIQNHQSVRFDAHTPPCCGETHPLISASKTM